MRSWGTRALPVLQDGGARPSPFRVSDVRFPQPGGGGGAEGARPGAEAIAATVWRGSWTSQKGNQGAGPGRGGKGRRTAGLQPERRGPAGRGRAGALRPGNVTSASGERGAGSGRGRLQAAPSAARCAPRLEDADPPGGGGMSAKERPKGKVIKDSVTLLPCFYFVEVGRPGPPGGSGDSGPGPGAGVRAPGVPNPLPLTFGELPAGRLGLPAPPPHTHTLCWRCGVACREGVPV